MKADRISRGRENEKAVIDAFLQQYCHLQNLSYKVVEWPDENKNGARHEQSVDAVARVEGSHDLAIEHTHVTAVGGQIKEAITFQDFRNSLEARLCGVFPFYLRVTIFGDHLYRGPNREANAQLICDWLKAEAANLPSQRSDFPVVPDAPPITIWKDEFRKGFDVNRWIRRPPPESGHLVKSFVAALQHKDISLRDYFRLGAETILLIQSDDVALLAIELLYQSFQQACTLTKTDHLGQVWLAHSHGHSDLSRIHCFRGPTILMRPSNPAEPQQVIKSQGMT